LSRLPILGSVLLGTVLTASACSGSCRRTSAPVSAPTVTALVLEVLGDSVRLVSARPARGTPASLQLDDSLAAIRRGDALWIEYSLRSAADTALESGAFAISMAAIVEGGPHEPGGNAIRVRRRVVTVPVRYLGDAVSIRFARVDPSDTPPEKWARVPLGASRLAGTQK
jgi:hypothetical protein